MIFLAPRASEYYYQRLNELRSHAEPYSIVTGNFGLCFLHAVSLNTKAIYVCDLDQGVLLYNELLIRLIIGSRSFDDFKSLLAGGPDNAARVWSILSRSDLYMMYMSLVFRMKTDPAGSSSTISDKTVVFAGLNLSANVFCWRFGEGVFADQESFRLLQSALSNSSLHFLRAPLTDIPWQTIDARYKAFFLVNNYDSPLYFRGDALIQSIEQSDAHSVRYLSWKRTVDVPSPDDAFSLVNELVLKEIQDEHFCSLGFSSEINHRQFKSLKELETANIFGNPLLVVCTDNLSPSDSNVKALCSVVSPCFLSVVFFGTDDGAEILAKASREGLLQTYAVSKFIQERECFLLKLELKQH